MRTKWLGGAALVALTTLALGAGIARAGTFPGSNGKIAFERTGADDQIFVMDPNGANQTNLTNHIANDASSSFSGDGERIAFASDAGGTQQIWVMDANGLNRTQLTFLDFADDPSFSPNGQKIAFRGPVGADNEIFVMNADGSNPVPVSSSPQSDEDPVFSPDGQKIVFLRNDGADNEIWAMDSNGSNQVPLTDDGFNEDDPSWSPDGQRIVFDSDISGDSEIFVMDANGLNAVPVTSNGDTDEDPVFSPDGQTIAYTKSIGPANQIYSVGANGGSEVPLTSGADGSEDPDWQALNPPACDLSGRKKQKTFRYVKVKVTCTNENASVRAGGKGKVPKVAQLSVASSSSVKKFKLRAVTVEVPPNQTTTLKLKVPRKARKALKQAARAGRKGRATVTSTATDDLGQSSNDRKKVTFRKKKRSG